jgi:2-polyprenyl-3-methyl-5-hydroxy-6-metoxy-1,4-benzoquinol methylase
MAEKPDRPTVEDTIKQCYSTWADNYHRDYYTDKASYPPVHEPLLRKLVVEAGCRKLLDAGCGPASLLRSFAGLGIDLYGFDLTPEMVDEARRVMAPLGVPGDHLWEGSVADAESFRTPGGRRMEFDAAICTGVFPHVPVEVESAALANLRAAVRPGGLVAIEARNQLFALFTLNRYSYQFFLDELVRPDDLFQPGSDAARSDVLNQLGERFRLDLPKVREGKAGEPGYDQVLSRTHNPLVLREKVAAAGFRDVRLLFYHYHCLPPMFETSAPLLFREKSLAMEDPHDWRGYFMASAFIVTGIRE